MSVSATLVCLNVSQSIVCINKLGLYIVLLCPNLPVDTLNFFYKHNYYKDTYGKKCEKISIILIIMLW